jgi:predicted P-loop ATPase
MRKQYWALHTRKNIRGSSEHDNLNKLREILNRMDLDNYAIFRNAPKFHSTTQTEFLVEHRNCQYFIRQGIESK